MQMRRAVDNQKNIAEGYSVEELENPVRTFLENSITRYQVFRLVIDRKTQQNPVLQVTVIFRFHCQCLVLRALVDKNNKIAPYFPFQQASPSNERVHSSLWFVFAFEATACRASLHLDSRLFEHVNSVVFLFSRLFRTIGVNWRQFVAFFPGSFLVHFVLTFLRSRVSSAWIWSHSRLCHIFAIHARVFP